jgi:carbamoyl-phosphate synthase large subunit
MRIGQGAPDIIDLIKDGKVDLVINTPTRGRSHNRDGYKIRRNAVEHGVPCITALDTANALLTSIEHSRYDSLSVIDISQL